MSTKLLALKSHLGALRRRRAMLRLSTAWSGSVLAVCCALLAGFGVDWTFQLTRPQRVLMLLCYAGTAWWAYRRLTRPYLGTAESEVDVALLVERQQRIDSDLVAALQFESPEAARWGSQQLEDAVIDYVAEYGSGINVFEGLSHAEFRRRMIALGVLAGGLLLSAAVFPGYIPAFLNRMFLGRAHYPTQTRLERIAVNGNLVFPTSETIVPRVPSGRPLKFEVECGGVLPATAEVRIRAQGSDLETVIPLEVVGALATEPAADPTAAPTTVARRGFTGELPRLIDSVTFEVYAGDAWTDPVEIEAIPLPVVTVLLEQTPPPYAAGAMKPTDNQAGSRQISVIEGSRVAIAVECGNKPLRSARLTVGQQEYPLSARDGDRRAWSLAESNSPLESVVEPIAFEVQVQDEDGLALEQPLQGYIRIQADRPPRVVGAVVTERVLPAARPTVSYGATDDYGLALVKLNRQVMRASGETEESTIVVRTAKEGAGKGNAGKEEAPAVLRGSYTVDLKPLKLVKGDEVRLTLEAVDFRGGQPGKSATSDPLVFQVTDESGILAGLIEADEKSARQLDIIIQRQLGIGESP